LLEGWKHDVRNLWWVIDYNRQSLDAVLSDRLFGRIVAKAGASISSATSAAIPGSGRSSTATTTQRYSG
jgi:pyruvate dehydrogenase complex dehydrogenase (E1) component